MDNSLKYWLLLLRVPGAGPVHQKKLLDYFGSIEKIFSAPAAEYESMGIKSPALEYLLNPSLSEIEQDLEWLARKDHYLIPITDSRYPALLREINDPPLVLFVHGDPGVLTEMQIGIVGSRNPTAGGRKTAQKLASELSAAGLVITSGLALGIDYCGHWGALEARGRTVAVMGNGLDRIYPARHGSIGERIAGNGALVSEFPPATPPLPDHFPRRNRIISGMSLGVVVIEAAERSGSLITARLAAEQGREVFAVPGSIYNPLSRGCHQLIKQGAKLTETVQDVLEELNIAHTFQAASGPMPPGVEGQEDPADMRHLLNHLSHDPVSIDELIDMSGLTADAVSSMLLVLEVQGKVSCSGGLYTRT